MSQQSPPPLTHYPFVVQQDRDDPNYVPARVMLAVRVLRDLHDQQAGVMVPGEPPVQSDGRELMPIEEQTRAEAHKMLQRYLAGELMPSLWESSIAGFDKPMYLSGKCQHCKENATFIMQRSV